MLKGMETAGQAASKQQQAAAAGGQCMRSRQTASECVPNSRTHSSAAWDADGAQQAAFFLLLQGPPAPGSLRRGRYSLSLVPFPPAAIARPLEGGRERSQDSGPARPVSICSLVFAARRGPAASTSYKQPARSLGPFQRHCRFDPGRSRKGVDWS